MTTQKQPFQTLAIISDFLLWGLLCVGVVWGAYMAWELWHHRRQQEIHLIFQDANELTPGALVKFIGVEVGTVHRIGLSPEGVRVVIKTHPDSIQLPDGAQYTIDFTGLAGSKSVDITPISGSAAVVKEPVRMRDTLDYQIDIAQSLKKGAENFIDFFGKESNAQELIHGVAQGSETVIGYNHTLLEAQHVMQYSTQNLKSGTQSIQHTLANFNAALAKVEPLSQQEQPFRRSIRFLTQRSDDITRGLNQAHLQPHFHALTDKFTVVQPNDPVAAVRKVESGLEKATQSLTRLKATTENAPNALQRFNTLIQPMPETN